MLVVKRGHKSETKLSTLPFFTDLQWFTSLLRMLKSPDQTKFTNKYQAWHSQ